MIANLMPHHTLAHFVKKQRKTSQRYQGKPLAIISTASQLFGYGSVLKDDLHLLDRMPRSEKEIRRLLALYLVDLTVSHERINRWKAQHFKRADVIKELRQYTAQRCNCSPKKAYEYMRDQSKISDECYFMITFQNLHDLYMFIKTVE